jgi:hypothetical protein
MMPRFPVVNTRALGQDQGEPAAPLPLPNGALYRDPNPDGSRKACANCIMWSATSDQCVIHSPDVPVTRAMMCGFHVFGQPMAKWMDLPGIDYVKPELSGLRLAGPGVSCASCEFYRAQNGQKGLCMGVSKPEDRKPPVPVEALGWCARYEPM